MSAKTVAKESAKKQLKAMLPKGCRLSFIIRSVSKSGMSRVMTPIVQKGTSTWKVDTRYIGRLVADVAGYQYVNDNYHSIRVRGCGMDMCFAVASELGQELYGDPNAFFHDVL